MTDFEKCACCGARITEKYKHIYTETLDGYELPVCVPCGRALYRNETPPGTTANFSMMLRAAKKRKLSVEYCQRA